MVTNSTHRRGPRRDVDTRTLIIDTAERMFAETSIGAVAVRAVAREAGVASRAVAYHFPVKRDLVVTVASRRAPAVFGAAAEELSRVGRSGQEIGVRDVVAALVAPYVRLLDEDPVGGLRWLKVMNQLALDGDQIWVDQLAGTPSLPELYFAAAGRVVPDIRTEEGQQRSTIAIFSMIGALASSDLSLYGRPLSATGLDRGWLDQLIQFTSGGLRGNGSHSVHD
ncbi:AcrR family transcriptional regulator [Mycobacterium frederiksbergense]|uniref:AcrR family transcriptional regulator n=1 Tax=Mycolicibacterium frederiksbergense TaxID=117567 RepID=A0ABT6L7Q0_9MYCO|nr:TetR/AcrR family transcriptional regulator [Mycolicibacterium frederiksbergense]MDH6198631.1 AcrR family transcriptional regulator [Mycolicibacterium frederiksbergense]